MLSTTFSCSNEMRCSIKFVEFCSQLTTTPVTSNPTKTIHRSEHIPRIEIANFLSSRFNFVFLFCCIFAWASKDTKGESISYKKELYLIRSHSVNVQFGLRVPPVPLFFISLFGIFYSENRSIKDSLVE